MELHSWSWTFLALYAALMLFFGWMGGRRITAADDFATARKAYGPWVLALAFASTAASGATFLGLPGLTYQYGMSAVWLGFLYPVGIYIGVLVCQRTVGRYGNRAGARSIPEYLGERYQSEALRVSVALFSLMLLFYLAGQLVAGLVMFEMMLGLPKEWAMGITIAVLLAYITLGGAHADILTDGAQGLLMVILALAIMFLFGAGIGAGGLDNLMERLRDQDARLLDSFNASAAITATPWSFIALIVAHIPLGLLPHIGNKLWALKSERSRYRFLILAFVFGLILPAVALGGLTARAVLGDQLLGTGGANTALPALFLEIFPVWLAALVGVGILSAVMSTADGLVISTSQVFANDIYRRSIAPRIHADCDAKVLDRKVLIISRVTTVLTLLGAGCLAWAVMDMNVVLLVWAGIGGYTAAMMGPLVLGAIWDGITRAGALAGFWAGAVTFVLIHSGIVNATGLQGTSLDGFATWFDFNAASPYSCATIGGLVSVLTAVVVSRFTEPLSKTHLDAIHGAESTDESD